MNAASPCRICQSGGHLPTKCPQLYEMLQPGFYKPSSNYRDEDEEDSLSCEINILQSIFPHTFFQECMTFFTGL